MIVIHHGNSTLIKVGAGSEREDKKRNGGSAFNIEGKELIKER
jgi:hypothetical protein